MFILSNKLIQLVIDLRSYYIENFGETDLYITSFYNWLQQLILPHLYLFLKLLMILEEAI